MGKDEPQGYTVHPLPNPKIQYLASPKRVRAFVAGLAIASG